MCRNSVLMLARWHMFVAIWTLIFGFALQSASSRIVVLIFLIRIAADSRCENIYAEFNILPSSREKYVIQFFSSTLDSRWMQGNDALDIIDDR